MIIYCDITVVTLHLFLEPQCCPQFPALPPNGEVVRCDFFPDNLVGRTTTLQLYRRFLALRAKNCKAIYNECRNDADCGCRSNKKCCYSGGIQGLPYKCIESIPCSDPAAGK